MLAVHGYYRGMKWHVVVAPIVVILALCMPRTEARPGDLLTLVDAVATADRGDPRAPSSFDAKFVAEWGRGDWSGEPVWVVGFRDVCFPVMGGVAAPSDPPGPCGESEYSVDGRGLVHAQTGEYRRIRGGSGS